MAVDRPNYRLSDAERQEALDALGEHVRTGRLDLTEFDQRSANVTAAKTRGDLEHVFADLPDPRPSVLGPVRPATPPAHRQSSAHPEPTWQQRLASAAVPIATIAAILLFFTVARAGIFVFVLPIVVAVIMGSVMKRR